MQPPDPQPLTAPDPAVESAVGRHAPWLIRFFAQRLAGVPELDPEDLAQDVLVVYLRNRERIQRADAEHKYLYGVAQKVLWARLREMRTRQKRERTLPARPEVPADLQPLLAAVQTLPDELRAVIEVYYASEMTYEQAAAVLAVPRATVQSRLRRALAELRMRLGEQS